jgi:hypothetical protein
VGFNVQPTGMASYKVLTYSGLQAGTSEEAPCEPTDWMTVRTLGKGSVRLEVTSSQVQRAPIAHWLASDAGLTVPKTHQEVLERMVDGVASALSVMDRRRRDVPLATFKLRVLPDGCRHVETVAHDLAQATSAIAFPVGFRWSDMKDPQASKRVLFKLLEIVSHESIHIHQMSPFDDLRIAAASWLHHMPSPGGPLSYTLELRAILVDRCLRQALLPNDWMEELQVQVWRDRRSTYRVASRADPWFPVVDKVFSLEYQILGEGLVNARDDRRLARLFPYCQMFHRQDSLPALDMKPRSEDRILGAKALRTIRAATDPMFFKGLLYDDAPLP